MRSNFLVLLLLAFPIAVHGQNAPTQAFAQWARGHVHPIASVDEGAHGDADLQTLRNIIGGAQVVAFGEPIHGGHEPLAMRNRLIRYGVTRLGFTAVALETGLSSSKRLYDHVLGRTSETDSALKEAFSYGFGDLPENLELLRVGCSSGCQCSSGRRLSAISSAGIRSGCAELVGEIQAERTLGSQRGDAGDRDGGQSAVGAAARVRPRQNSVLRARSTCAD
jgi:hypothetical protein